MTNGWADLLIGDGFWLGLVLIQVIFLLLSTQVKYGGWFSACFSVLLFLYYGQNLDLNSFESWGMIFTGVMVLIHLFVSR